MKVTTEQVKEWVILILFIYGVSNGIASVVGKLYRFTDYSYHKKKLELQRIASQNIMDFCGGKGHFNKLTYEWSCDK